ncbi:hypothetical protein RFM41_22325 [Mesorhizobium sp. VK25A]|uniref:Uncharacterized protein n=1 Tax=Mesorhizobium vachelliae TaxID=3072309 RepID=A0ABU5ABP8_9HYPH|nr:MULTISPECIES: hypothetical protein [unclassified Mesorhizobium]MDX8534027.1 hypothetical protein [Mesorhizobium sp. VK25D]MDX8546502.1 hypothetical protein [Mesorhizobium sp. VK25A]
MERPSENRIRDALGVASQLKVVDVAELISLRDAPAAESYGRVEGSAVNG